jgi:hypothetical protein
MAISPPPVIPGSTDRAATKGGAKLKRVPPGKVEPSVFDILNIFRRRWFLSRANLLTQVISAQKAEDGKISWVEFSPQHHSHLVKCAVALVPHPVHKVKKVMFVYILELLNGEGHEAFFNLKSGGRKAINAQREKKRLARKRSRAAKRERERKAAKAATLPTRERQCVSCGRKFASRKTARKHQCSNSKVVRTPREAASGKASQATPTSKEGQASAPPTSPAPTAGASVTHSSVTDPSHTYVIPVVTGESREQPSGSSTRWWVESRTDPGYRRSLRSQEELSLYMANGKWNSLGPAPPGAGPPK